jgi:hypothetical protein
MKPSQMLRIAEPAPATGQVTIVARLADLNSTFKWTRGGDAQSIWRRYGWRPPTEYRDDFFFGSNRTVSSS